MLIATFYIIFYRPLSKVVLRSSPASAVTESDTHAAA